MLLKRLLSVLLLSLLSSSALADFTNPFAPAWRGAAQTSYARWDHFIAASVVENPPDVAGSTDLDAFLVQLDPSAFLTAGNIYSFSAPIDCRLTDSVPSSARRVLLQVSTRGNELQYAGIVLSWIDMQGQPQSLPWTQHTELARTPISGLGVAVEAMFEWDLAIVPGPIASYEIRFTASGASTSLDALILDVEYAQEPIPYCTAKVNSLGCSPQIHSAGVPSASLTSGFTVRADQVQNNKVGLLLYSEFGRDASAFGPGGLLCVKAPLRRSKGFNSGGTPAPASDCTGVFSIDFNTFAQGGYGLPPNPASFLLVPGKLVTAQYWGRDPGLPAPNNFSLSNALEFTIAP